MDTTTVDTPYELATAFAAERPRLVRLCAWLSSDPTVAEDLAQETLFQAWRSRDRLSSPEDSARWLNGIARNVCARWKSRQRRDLRHYARLDSDTHPTVLQAATNDDFTSELERHELAHLLDRALALLPPETRQALIQHYVERVSHAEIAARLGLNEGTVAVRLHRGKLAFRRILRTDLRAEAEVFGLLPADTLAGGWRETRIWCPQCGQHRLLGYLDSTQGSLTLRCPCCSSEPGLEISNTTADERLLAGISGIKAAYSRVTRWAYGYYRNALAQQGTGRAPCSQCGQLVPLHLHLPFDDPSLHPSLRGQRGVYVGCTCRPTGTWYCSTTPRALALHLPEGRHFWQAHPRIRMLPEREVDVGGQTAVLTAFESLGSPAQFEVLSLRDSYEVICIYGTP